MDKCFKKPNKLEEAAKSVLNWASDNKELALAVLPQVILLTRGVGRRTGKAINKMADTRKENAKQLYCWDPAMGMRWALRRALTNEEKLFIEKEKKTTGKGMGEILKEMNLLK